ncbi:MAG: trimeric autotransporter adhesin, partial [Thermoleophilaceae bacterium]|nr:trimeric autotransporter adhesin [Thermoleophilaceae bacterium]
ASRVYDGTVVASASNRQVSGVIGGDVVSLSGGSASFADKNVGTGKTVSLSGASLSGAGAGNYNLTSVSPALADITVKDVTGSFDGVDRAYDATTDASTANRQVVGAIGGDAVSLSGGTATFADKNVGADKTVSLTGASLSGADAGNYNLTSVGTSTADITKKALTVTGLVALNKVYDGDNTASVNFAGASLNGVESGDSVSLITSGYAATFGNKNVGTAKPVAVTGLALGNPDGGNYSISPPSGLAADITVKDVTGSFTGVNKVYDATTDAATSNRQVNGAVGGDVVALTGGSATFDTEDVGTGKTVTLTGAALSGTDAGNYNLTSVSTALADITKKGLTVSGAVAQNKVYDGNNTATVNFGGASLTGIESGDVVTLDSSGHSATFNNENAGSGKPVTVTGVAIAGADAGNYTVSQPSLTADINAKGVTGSFSTANKVYDGTTAAAASNRQLTGAIGGDDVSLSGGSATFGSKAVGTGKTVMLAGSTLSGADAGNYNLTSVSTALADITTKGVTGSFSAANKPYDGGTGAAASSRSVNGAVGGDDVALTGGSATFGSKDVGTGKTVTLAGAALSGADAGNYNLTSVSSSTANITAKALTGSFTAASKAYDGTTAAAISGSSLDSGAVAGDAVTLDSSAASATFGSKHVGTGKTVTSSGFSLAGTDKDNYTLSMGTATADITTKGLSGSFTAADKDFDGTTAATILSRSLAGVVAGDAVALTGGTAAFADPNPGVAKQVTGAGFALTGADAGNYTIAVLAPTTATIRQRPPAGGEQPPTQEELQAEAAKLLGSDDATLVKGLKLGGLANAFAPKGQANTITYDGQQALLAVGGCATACTIKLTGVIELTGTSKASSSAKKRRIKLKSQQLTLKAGEMGVFRLKLTKKQQTAIRKAKRARLIVKITVNSGQRSASGTKTYKLKLKKKR